MKLIGFELRRIIGRKGSFFGVMGVLLAISLVVAFAADTTDQTEETWSGVLAGVLVLGGSVVGALAGSYDASQGIMRYLVLTGVPRWKLVAIRIPALLAALALIAVPGAIVGVVSMLGNDVPTDEIVRGLATGYASGAIWSIVALVVGTLMRANGPAIAISIVLYFVGGIITAAVHEWVSEDLADLLLPNAAGVFASFGKESAELAQMTDMSFTTATVITAVWLIGLTALAIARVERDEY